MGLWYCVWIAGTVALFVAALWPQLRSIAAKFRQAKQITVCHGCGREVDRLDDSRHYCHECYNRYRVDNVVIAPLAKEGE